MCLLHVKNLTTEITNHQKQRAFRLEHVSFTVNDGETIGIVGESASGKTTLARSLIGMVSEPGIVEGEIWLNRQNLLEGLPPQDAPESEKRGWEKVYEARMKAIRGKEIALMPQGAGSALSPFHPIGQQLRRAYQLGGGSPHHADALVTAILKAFKLEEQVGKYPHRLSGGQSQRAMLAILLCLDPTVLIVDEPITSQDTTLQIQIIQLLKGFKSGELRKNLFGAEKASKPRALVVISHDFPLIQQLADTVLVLRKGKLIQTISSKLLFSGHQTIRPYTQQFLNLSDLTRHRGKKWLPILQSEQSEADSSAPHDTSLDPNNLFRTHQQYQTNPQEGDHQAGAMAEPLLSIHDLRFSYPVSFIDKVFGSHRSQGDPFEIHIPSLEIYPNEIVGVIGESGCGKSTLLKLIVRLLPSIQEGLIQFKGDGFRGKGSVFDLTDSELRKYRKRIQMIFQAADATLNPGMQVKDLLVEAIASGPNRGGSLKERKLRMVASLTQFNLLGRESHYPDQLSGGEQRRVGVIRALALAPKVLICDEPFANLDVSLRNALINRFQALKEYDNLTFLLVLHDLSIAEYLCDRVVVMYLGQMVEIGGKDEVFSRDTPNHPYTSLLIDASEALRSPAALDAFNWEPLESAAKQEGGCAFRHRCPIYQKKLTSTQRSECDKASRFYEVSDTHQIACHFFILNTDDEVNP